MEIDLASLDMGFMKKCLCLNLWVHTSFPLEVMTKYQFPLSQYFGYILPKVESPKSLQINSQRFVAYLQKLSL